MAAIATATHRINRPISPPLTLRSLSVMLIGIQVKSIGESQALFQITSPERFLARRFAAKAAA
jgi:hypothetical protein